MDNSNEESQFSSLPLHIQLDIFKKLDVADRKIARLTCKHWFSLINLVQRFSFTISDKPQHYRKSIVLKSPFNFYSRIASLTVDQAVKPLPIYSSTRMDVPKAAELVLALGNSEDNILNLLRYYAVGCQSLSFQCGCFLTVANSTKMRIHVVLENITKFSIVFEHYNSYIRHFLMFYNHTRALSEFLGATSMPNLKTFAALMTCMDSQCNSVASGQAFVKNFGIFLDKHGKLIRSFFISYFGRFCGELFQHFSKLPNVVELTCLIDFCDVDLINPATRSGFWTPFASYTKLTSFKFGLPYQVDDTNIGAVRDDICTQFATMMLANNQQTLAKIRHKNSHGQGPFDWLHKYPYPSLTFLKFGVFGLYDDAATLFSNELSKRYKFPMLNEMNVKATAPFPTIAVESDFGHVSIRWIIQVAPLLKHLTLGRHDSDPLTLPLAHVRDLILGLQKLKYIKLRNWRGTATAETMDWLRNQAQIGYKNSGWHDGDCNIFIRSRPFVETIVQAN